MPCLPGHLPVGTCQHAGFPDDLVSVSARNVFSLPLLVFFKHVVTLKPIGANFAQIPPHRWAATLGQAEPAGNLLYEGMLYLLL